MYQRAVERTCLSYCDEDKKSQIRRKNAEYWNLTCGS